MTPGWLAAPVVVPAGIAPSPASGLSSQPLAPAWLVLPMAVVTLLVLAAHVQAMHAQASMPRSRRRIRTINGALMLVTVPVLAYAFGIATPARTQLFAASWSAASVLLALIIAVAMVDVANTWRLHAEERARLDAQIKGLRAAARREVQRRRRGGPSSDPPPAPSNE